MSDLALRHEPERKQRELLERILSSTTIPAFELFRAFAVFTPRFNLARFLSHYEIFKRVATVPGVIVDMGVYRGSSTFTWAKLCEIFCPTDIRKTVFGFDSFEGFPSVSDVDGKPSAEQDLRPGGYSAGSGVEGDLLAAREAMNQDRHLRHIERIEFVKGDVVETVPRFVRDRGDGLKVALLNLDLDLYLPTKVALEAFAPRMSRGGLIVVDEYATSMFTGETKAVDEFFVAKFGKRPKIEKFPWHSNPTGFIEVDW